jgi:phosphoesterase RecJ-like protein
MSSDSDFSAVGKFLRAHERFLIISHVRPDGDAFGSTLALGLSLRAMGKDVVMVNPDGMSRNFEFLPGSNELTSTPTAAPEEDRKIIAVDCAEEPRLGKTFVSWKRPVDLNIDHHVSNPGFGKVNCIDSVSPATAQILFELIEKEKFPCPANVASNLFVGLSTDTGSFRHRSTSTRTFEIAAKLTAAGADPTTLSLECYSSYPVARLLLLREALNEMHMAGDNRIAYFRLTPEMCTRSGATVNDSKDMVEYLQTVRTVEVAFMVETVDADCRRVSMRSRSKVDVQIIAARHGGGGHRLAAGIRTTMDADELEKSLVQDILTQLDSQGLPWA